MADPKQEKPPFLIQVLFVWLAVFLASPTSACQVCVAMPEKTLADRLLQAEQVILAREDPGRPFHFTPVEILKGGKLDASIDAFLNSTSRRQLKNNPDQAMLLIREQDSKAWQPVGITNDTFLRVVRRIISFSADWKVMETDNRQRIFEFVKYLDNPDRRLRELAYLEIGRAPYGLIHETVALVPLQLARKLLNDPFYYEWRKLAILLLGFSKDSADRTVVVEGFRSAEKHSIVTHLGAWTTAYIETGGGKAIDHVSSLYLQDRNRKAEELNEVLAALSVQGSDKPALRDDIISAYRVLLKNYPEMSVKIIHDLIAWQRWDLEENIRTVRDSIGKQQPLAKYSLDRYLLMATMKSLQVNMMKQKTKSE